ncbi:hypothetical protein GCM10008106_28260 [Mongoliitalea lutea]|uniref:Uncharacterized protein n=1 Tax=Mongoliitalea lutea TaxID=849756 RepID=A0A8J3CYP7_9BACT|nr:hypothetical protein GCM10008106_28260 [Mongoliitalea lutea]
MVQDFEFVYLNLIFFVHLRKCLTQNLITMKKDLISQVLKKYFIDKGKNLTIIHRYLRIKYRMYVDEKLLEKRLNNLSLN